jgi:RNA polymerase sigma factor (sigma-70 family)
MNHVDCLPEYHEERIDSQKAKDAPLSYAASLYCSDSEIRESIRRAKSDGDELNRLFKYLRGCAQNIIFGNRYNLSLNGVFDHEDLAQEACLRAFQKFPSFDPDEKARITTWLYSIVRNTFYEFRRKSRKYASDPDRAVEKAPLTQYEILADKERAELIDTLFSRVDGDYRYPLHLKLVEGYSIERLSEKTGDSRYAIRKKLRKGKTQLLNAARELVPDYRLF